MGILLCPPVAHAAEVRGVVRQGGSGAPVEGVLVVAGTLGAATDSAGRYAIADVPPGTYEVSVRDGSWRTLRTGTAELATDADVATLDLYVAPEGSNELVARYRARPEPGIRRVIEIDDATALPGTFGDPLRVLAAQPGLSRTPYDAGWLLIRGGDYDDPGLYLDGVRIPQIQHLGGFTSVLHPEMVQSFEFWPGVFPARFGSATSGAINVVPAEIGDHARAVAGVNLVFAHAFAEIPTRWGGVSVAARRSYLDGVLALVLGEEGSAIAPRFWDVQARAEIGPHAISLLGFSDTASTPAVNTDGVASTVDVRQQAAQIQGRFAVSEHTTLWTWLAWNQRDLEGASVPIRQGELQPGLRLERTAPLTDDGTWTVGFEGQQRLHRVVRDEAEVEVAAWVTDPYAGVQLGYPLTLWSEIRLETLLGVNEPSRRAWSPRGGFRWVLSPSVEVHAEVGQMHQPPAAELLYGEADGANLDLEQAAQIAGGVRIQTPRFAATVDAFHRTLGNLAGFEQDASLGQGAGTASGIETSARLLLDPVQINVLYQYVSTTRAEDERLPETIEPWVFDQPHRLEVRAAWRLPKDWTLSSRFRLGSGFPRSIREDGIVPASAFDVLTQQEVPLDLSDEDARLAPYHSLDLRIARTVTYRKWRLIGSFDVLNVYNRRVVEPVITGFGEAAPAYGFGLPILPIFGIEAEFFP